MSIYSIIPLEDTYLRIFEKPKKARLTRQVIDLNYGHQSPYRNSSHLSWQTDTKIYIWYYDKSASTTNGILIPEAYLLYRFFRDRQNALVLLPRNGITHMTGIAHGELQVQALLRGTSGLDASLELLKREYSLGQAELIRLEPTARFSVKPSDIIQFVDFQFNPINVLEKVVSIVKAPLIAVLLVTAGFTFYEAQRMEALVGEKNRQLAQLKRENSSVHSSLEQVRGQGAYWNDFISREQRYPDFYQALSVLASVIQRHAGYLNSVEFSDNRLTVWTGLKTSEAAIIKELLATGVFEEAKLLSSIKDSKMPEFNFYNLSITLRPLAAGGQGA
ncbi:hypothetical protein OR1_00496 [Geobacter sp. OR-1]|uniref:hypothetical protein n=1 Tax=Geobacter sp. OR-1 TaxID=1266765 RepID=UPI000541E4C5|nr:hypothetical protein [Geobacter sp. OR-1]GAM08225.1 hypothetical protein OR1_00496 [Geobacter sp. OR-1]